MIDNWKEFPRACATGTLLAPSDALAMDKTLGLDIEGFPVLLARTQIGVFAYVNACPHQFLPLDYRSEQVLSTDGAMLRCSNHEAGFDVSTGVGQDGFAAGCRLLAIPIVERDGNLVITD